MLSWLRVILLVTAAANTAGCTAVALKVVDEVDATVSKLSQSDCQLVRMVHGMDVCRSTGSEAILPAAYCYRTLGGVDCYDRADPGDRPILRQATRATTGLE
ncbi:MAG: hypothetical protein H8E30_19275 [Alphaproteobacteria bacterium]|nr:hypothetical protein [Alphaproteobacteria bacterium]